MNGAPREIFGLQGIRDESSNAKTVWLKGHHSIKRASILEANTTILLLVIEGRHPHPMNFPLVFIVAQPE